MVLILTLILILTLRVQAYIRVARDAGGISPERSEGLFRVIPPVARVAQAKVLIFGFDLKVLTLGQAFQDQVLDLGGVGLAAGGLHDRADQDAGRLALAVK